MEMIKKYANGFAITINSQTGEACITLLENRPVFDVEQNDFSSEVIAGENIIMPYSVFKELGIKINECVIADEEELETNGK